ncbi:MAG: DUF2130 domain-containing protein [Planctomycetes bacterium]|nr:DUF2130 domain-containing protein [Planctomycetota bacterium]
MADTIRCPNCNVEIEVSAVLSAQLRAQLQKEVEAQARRKDEEIAKREENLGQREQVLDASRRTLDQQVAERVAQEQPRLLLEAEKKAQEAVALEVHDLTDQLNLAKNKLGEAQRSELQLRQERRDLEAQRHELELTVTRTIDVERAAIREEAKREAEEQNRLNVADKEKLITDLRGQIDDLKRIAEKGSPQARGEVMELELEELLRDLFPHDTIDAVPVGAHGGDILQRVHDNTGLDCGVILWEAKRTKNWSDGWLPKLRNDQRAAKAHVAVLTSEELPKGLETFGCIDGVWVTSRHCLTGLAAALRHGMIEAARTRRSLEGRRNKVELLYTYLAGSEFRQRIEGIVEAFMTLKDDLESEKRSMHRLWAKREKQLERAALNTAGLYGDLGGILGSSLPQIANLELAMIALETEPPALEPVGASDEDSRF